MDDAGLPSLYTRWLEELLAAPLPREPRATCGDCAMRREMLQEVRFGETKCCTFFPALPSFAVGRLLLDEDSALADGQARVRARIADGQQVTPLGIGRPESYLAVYGPAATFGVAVALRCPYYAADGGRCTIWRHRDGVCSTWFCKHERGAFGWTFWNAVRALLERTERRLARELAVDLGIDEAALDTFGASIHTIDPRQDPDLYAAYWGRWAGREVEYFQACGRSASSLSWSEVRARCGAALDELAADARASFARASAPPPLPDLVQIRPLRRAGGDGKRVHLQSYSPFDPVSLPEEAARALAGGGAVPVEVLLDRGASAGVDRPLLERLWEFGLVEDASE
jgi:hypothetical protein